MFDFGFSEIVLTSAIALIVLGPEKLPKVARQVGNWMGRARSMARQLTEQLEREVDAEDLLQQSRKNSKTNTGASNAGTIQAGNNHGPITSDPVPFDHSAYTPPHNVASAALPLQDTPREDVPVQAAPTYSAQHASPPHGADWHPAPPENKTSDG